MGAPRNEAGNFIALFEGDGGQEATGPRPNPSDFMPTWTDKEATHFMMYESTSEGTPLSPAFATPEELARWLVENNASAFVGETASYEGWLRVARGGFACSAVIVNGVLTSGVAAGIPGPPAGTHPEG